MYSSQSLETFEYLFLSLALSLSNFYSTWIPQFVTGNTTFRYLTSLLFRQNSTTCVSWYVVVCKVMPGYVVVCHVVSYYAYAFRAWVQTDACMCILIHTHVDVHVRSYWLILSVSLFLCIFLCLFLFLFMFQLPTHWWIY